MCAWTAVWRTTPLGNFRFSLRNLKVIFHKGHEFLVSFVKMSTTDIAGTHSNLDSLLSGAIRCELQMFRRYSPVTRCCLVLLCRHFWLHCHFSVATSASVCFVCMRCYFSRHCHSIFSSRTAAVIGMHRHTLATAVDNSTVLKSLNHFTNIFIRLS